MLQAARDGYWASAAERRVSIGLAIDEMAVLYPIVGQATDLLLLVVSEIIHDTRCRRMSGANIGLRWFHNNHSVS